MAYTLKKKLANRANYGAQRKTSDIRFIVVHFTANDGDHDESNANYFANNVVKASAHYFADDDSVTQSVPDDYVAYSVGGAKYRDCVQTGGGILYKIATNQNTLNIEMCDTIKDGKIMAQAATFTNTIKLIRKKMKQYNIDIDHVIRHFDVNGKRCPAYMVDEAKWQTFKARILGYRLEQQYKTVKACYLRRSPGVGDNKVRTAELSEKVQSKCTGHYAKLRRGSTFTLIAVRQAGTDVWGRMEAGYWLPLKYKGVCRANKVK